MRLLRQRSKFTTGMIFTALVLGIFAVWQVIMSPANNDVDIEIKSAEHRVVLNPPVNAKGEQLNSGTFRTSNRTSSGYRNAHAQNSALLMEDRPVATAFKKVSALHPDVRVVPSTPSPDLVLPYKDCVPLPNSPKPEVKICLHPVADDRYVSGAIKAGSLWEENLILSMTDALETDPKLQLVDLGCNIGEYTLWAAAMGRHVLAVEMLESNIHLVQTSLLLSNLSSLVTMVNNALYRDHRKLQTTFLEGNLGGSRLNDSSINDPNVVVNKNKKSITVNTVCLDDLIPLLKSKTVYLKMDIENSEHHALAGADRFFNEVNVKFVQMEWLDRSIEEVMAISHFMTIHGYMPSTSALAYAPVDINIPTINGHDVFFIKSPNRNL